MVRVGLFSGHQGRARVDVLRSLHPQKRPQAWNDAQATIPKPPWQRRKEDYIAHVPKASASVRLVSASDKLHNARAILRDFRRLGDALWGRFTGGKEGTLWYYRALVTAFREAGTSELVEELDRVVSEIEQLAGTA